MKGYGTTKLPLFVERMGTFVASVTYVLISTVVPDVNKPNCWFWICPVGMPTIPADEACSGFAPFGTAHTSMTSWLAPAQFAQVTSRTSLPAAGGLPTPAGPFEIVIDGTAA